jgi:hypothetical protein
MNTGAVIVVGAVIGLGLGIVVSVATDVPLAPEAGLLLGALIAWLSRRGGGTDTR